MGILKALILASILSVSTSLTVINAAVAYPEIPQTANAQAQRPSQNENRLPPQVTNAVRQDLSGKTGIAPGQLRITQFSRQTWPDGCLGLPEPDQFCTQALVEGWRVVVSHQDKTWVYRTNASGSLVKLETTASQTKDNNKLKPVPIPASELPPPLTQGMIFRAISSGGFAGLTYETVLMNDGRLMRVRMGDANDSDRSVRQISPQQLRQFQRLIQRNSLSRFNGMSYPAPSGSADFITVTISSSAGTTRYADMVQNNLPQPLQQVVQAWNQITSATQ
ncbi:MAG TPA: hypothetical protein DCY88_25180 [Cyanobacteria bacterium UBA11372]|nr:hypothetical protein [Cyanobacteria bacterium UBA11372]